MKHATQQINIQPPCNQLVIDWCLKKLQQANRHIKTDLLKELGTWIAYVITYQYRYEEQIVDSGYDISVHAHATEEPYNLDYYETVKDFLQECNGNTVATYVSGCGFQTETYENDVLNWVEEKYNTWLIELIEAIALRKQSAPPEVIHYVDFLIMTDQEFWLARVWDDFLYYLTEFYELFIYEFENMNLKFVYRKYLPLAQQQYLAEEKARQEKQLLAKQQERISRQIARCFKLLCPTNEKITMNKKEIVYQVLDKLSQSPQNFTKLEVARFVHSPHFANQVSNRLRELCRAKLNVLF